jgi:hypothetical protein
MPLARYRPQGGRNAPILLRHHGVPARRMVRHDAVDVVPRVPATRVTGGPHLKVLKETVSCGARNCDRTGKVDAEAVRRSMGHPMEPGVTIYFAVRFTVPCTIWTLVPHDVVENGQCCETGRAHRVWHL